MTKTYTGKLFFMAAMMSLSFAGPAFSKDVPLFYHGAFDDKKAEAPNGATANADYIDWAKKSSFGGGDGRA
jgi:hypothetical protein